jgi:aspartate racemase
VIPDAHDREIVHRVIYEELCLGKVVDASRGEYRRVMDDLVRQGAQAIILGCTEITLLVQASDSTVALFDTTRIHARRAAEWALGMP